MRRLDFTSDRFKVKKPQGQSEFEVQAYLYMELKQRGFDVRGEVNHLDKSDGKTRVCRFDLVIFRGDDAVVIIEVKHGRKRAVNVNNRQPTRYREYGVPVYFITGILSANAFLAHCDAKHEPKQPRKAWQFDRFASLGA